MAMLPAFAKAAGRGVPGSTYDADCVEMAKLLGKKKVYWPFWASLDNAKIHPHGRLRLLTAREPPPPILAAMRAQVFPLLNAAAQTNSDVSTRLIAVVYGNAQLFPAFQQFTATQVMSAPLADAFIKLYYEFEGRRFQPDTSGTDGCCTMSSSCHCQRCHLICTVPLSIWSAPSRAKSESGHVRMTGTHLISTQLHTGSVM
jgi:hypothetical protein